MHLLQALIASTHTPTFAAAWWFQVPDFGNLEGSKYGHVPYGSMKQLIPLYIRSIHGHSGPDQDTPVHGIVEWEVTPKDVTHVFHAGQSGNLDSIIRNGILTGGPVKGQRRRAVYLSIADPRECIDCIGRLVRSQLKDPIKRLTKRAWPPSEDDDVIYVLEVQRCNELDLRLNQDSTGAVLCRRNIPPECISKVTDLRGNILFKNDLLIQTPPQDRKAKMDVGDSIRRAHIFLQINHDMEGWPKNIIEIEAAQIEKKYCESYDYNFNDEQMCEYCKQFCYKGIKFCTKCRKALLNRDNPNEWDELQIAHRTDFANAALTDLILKANTNCRSLRKPYGPVAKYKKGLQIHDRCKRGITTYVKETGRHEKRSFAGCEDRWEQDVTFRKRMIDKNGFVKEDMKLFDEWATQPRPKPKPMPRKQREELYGDQKWKLAQKQDGGNDTVATALYPQYMKDNAAVSRPHKEVTCKEVTCKEVTWKEQPSQYDSSSWYGSSSWKASPPWKDKQSMPSSSSTSWKQSSWQSRGWEDSGEKKSNWPSAPWKQENQWKRQKS